jgi:hypothetical protein
LADVPGTLVLAETGHISRVTAEGKLERLAKSYSVARSREGRVYVCRSRSLGQFQLIAYDREGARVGSVPIPSEVKYMVDFLPLSGGGFAFFDNKNDRVHFAGPNGRQTGVVDLPGQHDSRHLQNMFGVAVGNKLVVSENGDGHLVAIDLTTREASIFRNLTKLRGWLGAIAHADGTYYICQNRRIFAFEQGGDEVRHVATVPVGSITGIAVVDGSLFVVANGATRMPKLKLSSRIKTRHGALYRIDLRSGKVTEILSRLKYPTGILHLAETAAEEGG